MTRKKEKIKRSGTDLAFMWIMFALFVLYAISLMFPFLWCLMNSFKGMQEFFYNVNGLPENWYFDNWKNSLTLSIDNNITIPQMYLNSVILTVGCTFFSMFSCSATAYVLTKFDFYGKSAIYTAAIVIMMIPTMGSMAAMYRLYNTIGLINTYTGIFITASVRDFCSFTGSIETCPGHMPKRRRSMARGISAYISGLCFLWPFLRLRQSGF